MSIKQENRFIRCTGDAINDLLLLELSGEEALSAPYRYTLSFRSSLTSAELDKYLGKELGCIIGDAPLVREIHGVLTSIDEVNDNQGISTYQGILEPRLSLLRLSRDLRVFQHINVPDLVCKVLREHGINSIDLRLSAQYAPREYCIQYRESTFDFIHRLLEQEGIYYFFEHSASEHILVLADSPSSHRDTPVGSMPFHPVAGIQNNQGISAWSIHSSLSASSVAFRGFNMVQAVSVEGESRSREVRQSVDGIQYVDIAGNDNREELATLARLKMEQLESGLMHFRGNCNAWWMSCGETFHLTDHPSSSGHYRIQSMSLAASSNIDGVADYSCDLLAGSAEKNYRPAQETPIPNVAGIITAKVVGPASEEIYTDEYGRIKIQFHWDNESRHDDSSSCWVRVSQPWTGGRFGGLFLPRVGSEVIVSFMQGNPDYPMVTGTVFNGQNKPPLTLPGDKNQSGFMSRSSKEGTVEDGHVFCFDDTKDAEKLLITSQKDLLLTIKNDVISEVSHAVDEKIGAGRTTEITEGSDSLTLKKGDYSIDVQGNMTASLTSGNHKMTISGGGSNVKADNACVLESTQSIELKVGSSKISITPAGITLSATTIKIEGTGTAELKSAMVTVNGSGTTQIKGGMVTIG